MSQTKVIKFRTVLLETLRRQRTQVITDLNLHGFKILSARKRAEVIGGQNILHGESAVVVSRVKKDDKIKDKMARFGEARSKILDIIGHRIVVADLGQLEKALQILKKLGETPTKDEMLLRKGKLQFKSIRDYRKISHKGKSNLTSSDYNEAVHMNRKIFGFICELQIVTYGLYKRAFVSRSGDVSHTQFARRRTKKYV